MILLGIGANLDSKYGNPPETIEAVKPLLEEKDIHIKRSSSLWKTEPIPYKDQPWYFNAVFEVETALEPQDLMRMLLQIEHEMGKVRTFKNASRIIDLDIVDYNEQMIDTDILIAPHPRMHERAFVLYPMRELAPDWVHPALKKPISALIEALPDQGIELHEKVA